METMIVKELIDKLKALPQDNLFVNKGWQCPICGRVYSPTTPMCPYCGNKEFENSLENH